MVELFFLKKFLIQKLLPYSLLTLSISYIVFEIICPKQLKNNFYEFIDKLFFKLIVVPYNFFKHKIIELLKIIKIKLKIFIQNKRNKKEIKKKKLKEKEKIKQNKRKLKLNKKIKKINDKVEYKNKLIFIFNHYVSKFSLKRKNKKNINTNINNERYRKRKY